MALWDKPTKTIAARCHSKNERDFLALLLICGQRVFKKLRGQKKDISAEEFLRRVTKEFLK